MEALQLTEAMEAFVERLGSHGTVRDRARRLYSAILDGELDVRYNEDTSIEWRPDGSKSARSVFEQVGPDGHRFAMCLEYTLLFVALARRMGLEAAGFRDFSVHGSQDGFTFGHVVAGVLDGNEWRVLDLTNRRFYRQADGFQWLSDVTLEAYVHNNTGLIFRTQGRLAEAEAALSKAVELESSLGAFWYNRGCVLLLQGLASAAEGDLSHAAELSPGSVAVLTNLAVAQHHLGHIGDARSTLYKARTLAPGDARVAYNLGVLAYAEDDYETAAMHWKDALIVDPSYDQARRSLGRLLRALGESDEGLLVLAGLRP